MIRVQGLSFTVGAFSLRDISLEVASGEYFILLGPTGAGKSLFIECLCGLLRPETGTIEINGRDVTRLAPRLREIGYVPQQQGLCPHLKVVDNIAFPLRARHLGSGAIRERVDPLVELLGLEGLLDRLPAHLSGGERQKVALARALAARPELLLLDEPVSALDESSRERLCADLRRIHHELQVTTIHVSHNFEEALTVGDRAGVLHNGCLVQTGSVTDLLRRPASEFVARFFRNDNVYHATAVPQPGGDSALTFAGHTVRVPSRHEGSVTFTIRPEALMVHDGGAALPNGIPARLVRVTDRGPYRQLEFDAGVRLTAYGAAAAETFPVGSDRPYIVIFPPQSIHVLPA